MSDTYNALTVVLEKDLTHTQMTMLKEAIEQLRFVLTVEPHRAEIVDYVALHRIRREIGSQLWSILYPPETPG